MPLGEQCFIREQVILSLVYTHQIQNGVYQLEATQYHDQSQSVPGGHTLSTDPLLQEQSDQCSNITCGCLLVL